MTKEKFGKVGVEYPNSKFTITLYILENMDSYGIQVDRLNSDGSLKSESAYDIAISRSEIEKMARDMLEGLF